MVRAEGAKRRPFFMWSGQMSVYTEFLDHVRGSESRPGSRGPGENPKSNDFLMTGLLMRAVMCLAFIGTGGILSLL
jgi:hypothetical protein